MEIKGMNGATKFVDWLSQMGYLDEKDISIDGVDIARDINKVKEVVPKFYNMLMCMCDCNERATENINSIKGYKVFNPDWTCRGFQYEVGQTYEEDVEPMVCKRGFHFCEKAADCFNYYRFNPENKVAEVVALGEVDSDGVKSCTNKIQIVREVPWDELLRIVNTGKDCTGLCNAGDRNTGDWNTGDRNTGNRNTGNRNTGLCNAGDRNTGDWNTGDRNTGKRLHWTLQRRGQEHRGLEHRGLEQIFF